MRSRHFCSGAGRCLSLSLASSKHWHFRYQIWGQFWYVIMFEGFGADGIPFRTCRHADSWDRTSAMHSRTGLNSNLMVDGSATDMYTAKGEKSLDAYCLRSPLPAHELAIFEHSFMQAIRVSNAYPHVRYRDLDIRRVPRRFVVKMSPRKKPGCCLVVTFCSSGHIGIAIQTIVLFRLPLSRVFFLQGAVVRLGLPTLLPRFLATSWDPGDIRSVEQADDVVLWEINHLLWFVRQTTLDSWWDHCQGLRKVAHVALDELSSPLKRMTRVRAW